MVELPETEQQPRESAAGFAAGLSAGDRSCSASPGRQKRTASQPELPSELSAVAQHHRILELELENLRLTRLVADLLLKNQRLRESN